MEERVELAPGRAVEGEHVNVTWGTEGALHHGAELHGFGLSGLGLLFHPVNHGAVAARVPAAGDAESVHFAALDLHEIGGLFENVTVGTGGFDCREDAQVGTGCDLETHGPRCRRVSAFEKADYAIARGWSESVLVLLARRLDGPHNRVTQRDDGRGAEAGGEDVHARGQNGSGHSGRRGGDRQAGARRHQNTRSDKPMRGALSHVEPADARGNATGVHASPGW